MDVTDHASDTTPTTDATTKPSRLPTVLVVVATVLAVLSALTTWVRVQMLDTDEWTELSADLLAEEEVQSALAVFISNELFERIDLQSEIGELLPEDLSPLAGPLVGALREPITNGIETVIASNRFQQLWTEANRTAHARLVAIIRDETVTGVSTADGTVTLELGEVVRSVGESVGVPDDALDRLPEDAGRITVVESEELADVQTAVRVLDFLAWFMFVVVVGLYALAVFLARGRRVQMLRTVGLALAIGGFVLLLLRQIGVRLTVDAIVANPANEPAAAAVAGVATSLLRSMAWGGIVYGLLAMGVAFLLGDHRFALAGRRQLGRATESTAGTIAVVVVLFVLLLWWSPGDLFESWVRTLVLVALAAGAVVAIYRKVDDERTASGPGQPDPAATDPVDPDPVPQS